MEEDVEVLFQVGVAVGIVGEETHTGEVVAGCVVEASGQAVGPGVATGCVGAPATGVHPSASSAGSVGVDRDQADIALAQLPAPGVHAFGAGTE